MFRYVALTLVFVFPLAVRGQSSQYPGDGLKLWGQKRAQLDASRTDAMKALMEKQKLEDEYRQKDQQLRDQREVWLARYKIYENVTSLRSKDAVMRWVDDARVKLGASEKEGYQRLGVYNPFDGRSYVRYFDANTGAMVISEVRGEYQDLQQQRKDWETKRTRQIEAATGVQTAYEAALKPYMDAVAGKKEVDQIWEQTREARVLQLERDLASIKQAAEPTTTRPVARPDTTLLDQEGARLRAREQKLKEEARRIALIDDAIRRKQADLAAEAASIRRINSTGIGSTFRANTLNRIARDEETLQSQLDDLNVDRRRLEDDQRDLQREMDIWKIKKGG